MRFRLESSAQSNDAMTQTLRPEPMEDKDDENRTQRYALSLKSYRRNTTHTYNATNIQDVCAYVCVCVCVCNLVCTYTDIICIYIYNPFIQSFLYKLNACVCICIYRCKYSYIYIYIYILHIYI